MNIIILVISISVVGYLIYTLIAFIKAEKALEEWEHNKYKTLQDYLDSLSKK